MRSRLFPSCVLVIAVASAHGSPSVIFVDSGAPANGDGLTWDTAFSTLQDGLLAASNPAASSTEIRVGQGLYQPDLGGNETQSDRAASFHLMDDVAIRGGYAGYGAADPDARDADLYPAILTGDLAGDDGPGFANNGENSYHVIWAENVQAGAIVEGCTITGGNATSSYPHSFGGGVNAVGGSATYLDCTFTGNYASTGGGMSNFGSNPSIYNCLFAGNVSSGSGGGIENQASSPLLVNCIFVGNQTINGGGAGVRFLNNCYPSVVNCTLFANTSGSEGGAFYVSGSSQPCVVTISNCIMWGNSAALGDDEFEQIGMWGDGVEVVVNYCCIEDYTGAIEGLGNIADDPAFVDADGADDVPGTIDDDLHLTAGSACSDAGNNFALPADTADLDNDGDLGERIPVDAEGDRRIADDAQSADSGCAFSTVVDMGAFEVDGDSADVRYGDVDGDGNVDIDDLFGVLGHWGPCTDCRPSDVNGSGTVDIDDVFAVLGNWG